MFASEKQVRVAPGLLADVIMHDFDDLLQGIGSNLDLEQLCLEQGSAAETGRCQATG